MKPAQQRACVRLLQVGFRVSERRACRVIGQRRSSQRQRSRATDQTALRQRIRAIAAVRVRYGQRRIPTLLSREGWQVHHQRVQRLDRLDGLALRLTSRKKRVSALRPVLAPPQAPHQQWSMDFVQDSLYDGRRFRALTLVDTMRRERPAIAVDPSLPGRRVVAVLERLTPTPGLPQVLPVDNGPAVISQALDEWAHRRVPAS